MSSFEQFCKLTAGFRPGSQTLDNLSLLGLPEDSRRLGILWMYPDVLSLHGGRGDLMALLRLATAAALPVEIRRIDQPTDPIPLEQADLLYFCPGDLTSMPDLIQTLMPLKAQLQAFGAAGKCIFANGSTGAILARQLRFLDGRSVEGLGLLAMDWQERPTVHGDDLWLVQTDGTEIIGNEIRMADVTLEPGQAPFAGVRYGRGNCGDGFEGAMTGGVIYTGCLGPVLARNPALAVALLDRCAKISGMNAPISIPQEQIRLEQEALSHARAFISRKCK